MPDAAPPIQPASSAGKPADGPLTPERIERTLADFRDWLTNPPPVEEPIAAEGSPVDLQTLVGQFIALRHEVNLQTKASRASLEQNAETLRRLDESLQELQIPSPAVSNDDVTRPLLRTLIDVYDVLALSLHQVERQKTAIVAGLATVLQAVEIEPLPTVANAESTRPGFWKRLFGASNTTAVPDDVTQWRDRAASQFEERDEKVRTAVDFLQQALDGLITGYAMSLNRIERVLPQFGLERLACEGQRFDPEMMEVVEVVAGGERSPGEVVEEVRRGYRLNGSIFRYAQVRVAR